MAQKKDRAEADVPADAPIDDADFAEEVPAINDVELTESEKVAQAAAGARPARKQAGESGKGHATPRRKGAGDAEHKRTTPAQFVREVVSELKKVVWPTGEQLQQYFVVVLVFVLIMIGIVSLLDLGFGAAILKLFG